MNDGRDLEFRGTFEVEVHQIGELEYEGEVAFGRTQITKRWSGDFQGESSGEMLTVGTGEGATMAAGYVAQERARGTLAGRSGTFVLQHLATAGRAGQRLEIEIVPGTGTGELASLRGVVEIDFSGGGHAYVIRCPEDSLPSARPS